MARQYAIDPAELAKILDISPTQSDILLAGGRHPYRCRCKTCREWWRLMGPDPDTEEYGPFTREEIEEGVT